MIMKILNIRICMMWWKFKVLDVYISNEEMLKIGKLNV